jgi:hypothetical protein
MAAMTNEENLERERERGAEVPIFAVLPASHLHSLRDVQKPLGLGALHVPTCLEPLEDGETGERSFTMDAYNQPLQYITTDELLAAIKRLKTVPPLVAGVRAFVQGYRECYGDVWDVWILYWC